MSRAKKEKRVFRPQGTLDANTPARIFWIQPKEKTEPPIQVKGFDKESVYHVHRLDDPTNLYIFYFKSYFQEVLEPKYEVNTRIKTFRPTTPNSDWDNTSIRGRKWGVTGIIAKIHITSSGKWCEVVHDTNPISKGDYQFSELIPL